MKNIDNFLADFFALAAIALKEKTEKPQAEKDTTEKSTTEKQCNCTGNHCKNHQDFYKELLADIIKCKSHMIDVNIVTGCMDFYKIIYDIEKKLCAEIEKSRTEND